MAGKKSISKNYVLNLLYQIFSIVTPIITAPYLSRALGANTIGQYNFTASLNNYFLIFGALGFGYYAQREIARFQNDKAKQSSVFWEILIVRFFSVGIAVLVYVLLGIFNVFGDYSVLMWWWIIALAAVELDVSFLFQGNEDFQTIVVRNILVKILSIICIFVFVKTATDLWVYILCSAGGTLLGNLSLWLRLPKVITRVPFKELHPAHRIIPAIRLFIPTIAVSVYTILDKTLIGVLVSGTYVEEETQVVNGVSQTVSVTKRYSDLENGYYSEAEQIVKMAMTIVTSLGTVMIPRNSKEFSDNHLDKVKSNVYFTSDFVWFLGIPMCLGIAAVAPNLIPWFLGAGFDKSSLLMQVFSPLVVIIGFSNLLGLQYLIPTRKDTKFTLCILAGAVTNLILNCALIPFYWSVGAVVASVIAECIVTGSMLFVVRKELSFPQMLKQCPKKMLAGGLMFAAVYVTQMFLRPTWYYTLLLVFEGVLIYVLLVFLFKDEFAFTLLNMAKTKLFHKKGTHLNA